MKIFNRIESLTLPKSTIAVGAFDALHCGHRILLGKACERAAMLSIPFTLITFDPLPHAFFHPEQSGFNILTTDERLHMLESLGVDHCILLPFTQALMDTPADIFLGRMKNTLHMESLWIGTDFSLGKDRQGNAAYLRKNALLFGYQLVALEKVEAGGIPISATRIRKEIANGAVSSAAQLLGYEYFFTNTIIHGDARGRKLGYPTLNMQIPIEKIVPAFGVYATRTTIEAVNTLSITNIGIRPTFNLGNQVYAETYLLNGCKNVYGKQATVAFAEFLRPEIKFTSAEELTSQIQKDIVHAQNIL